MRCTDCLLQRPESAALPLDGLLEQLDRCGDCPLVHGEGALPAVRLLAGKGQEGVRALRKLGNRARKAESEQRELVAAVEKYEEKITKLEALQKISARETEDELRQKIGLVARQEAALHAMAAPIIHVGERVLVLPVIGTLDRGRAEAMTERLLREVQASRSTHAILDLTGVDEVNTETADHLLRVSHAVRLLGASVILTGMRPRVAQTVVRLGVDLSAITTMRSVGEALRACGAEGESMARYRLFK